jgi:hypothetical protein
MSETDLIAQVQKEYDRRENAEEALTQCMEICESYFKYGYTNEPNNARYGAIIKIVQKYFDKIKKEEDNEIGRIQSKHK